MNRLFKKTLAVLAALILCCAGFTGCGNQQKQVDTVAIEIKQNDYKGGIVRAEVLQSAVLDIMENMKANNQTIRESSPNSFWTTDGYQDFVVNFLNSKMIIDTKAISEESGTWKEVVSAMSKEAESRLTTKNQNRDGYILKSGISVTRNEKDDYSITGVPIELVTESKKYEGKGSYRILYDCDKDWVKSYVTFEINPDLPDVTADLFEYARIDADTFAVQTSNERLLVKFKPASEDTELRSREIQEFYYSKLTSDSKRTTYKDYQNLTVYDAEGNYNKETSKYNDMMNSYGFINEKGDLCTQYGKNDSMFLTDSMLENVTSDWVFEDKSLQQAIIYKDGALVVTTYNKLSENYERFIYALDGVSDADINKLESMVEITNLVGVQAIGDKDETDTASSTDSSATDSSSVISDSSSYAYVSSSVAPSTMTTTTSSNNETFSEADSTEDTSTVTDESIAEETSSAG